MGHWDDSRLFIWCGYQWVTGMVVGYSFGVGTQWVTGMIVGYSFGVGTSGSLGW